MKKSKIVVLFILGFVLGALAVVGINFVTVGDVAWQEYVEERLIPTAVLALSAITTLYISLQPHLSKILLSADKFSQATEDVNTTVQNGKKTETYIALQDQKIAAFSEQFDELKKVIIEGIGAVQLAAENSEKILRIGFGNTAELVKKGYAAEIAKVGKTNEQDKET